MALLGTVALEEHSRLDKWHIVPDEAGTKVTATVEYRFYVGPVVHLGSLTMTNLDPGNSGDLNDAVISELNGVIEPWFE